MFSGKCLCLQALEVKGFNGSKLDLRVSRISMHIHVRGTHRCTALRPQHLILILRFQYENFFVLTTKPAAEAVLGSPIRAPFVVPCSNLGVICRNSPILGGQNRLIPILDETARRKLEVSDVAAP